MWTLAAELDRTLRAAGIAVDGVSIGNTSDKATWKVTPASLQSAAQPTIDAFVIGAQSVIDADVAADAVNAAADKDLIATLAIIAQQTDVNWGTKTVPQKVAAVQALMTAWKAMRAFVEKNL